MLPAIPDRETNFNGTIAFDTPSSSPATAGAGSYLRPASRDQLVDALKDMSSRGLRPAKIVVVGGFSSFEFPQLSLADEDSDEALSLRGPTSPHLLVDVSAMNRILHVDKQSLTVTVEAGITYWDLANQLREKGLAVENLSAYPEVTVGGASGTGTHGSGHAFHGKNQADQFIALEVVNARGDIQRIVDPRLLGTYHQAEYFVDNRLASQAVHAFLREADKDDRFITALPTGLKCRFVSSDDQWMSATSNVDGVELYLALQLSLYGSRSEIDAILKRIEDCLDEAEIPFACHWGKLCHGGHGRVNRKLKDRAKAMDAARAELDPDDAFLDAGSELAKLLSA